MRQTWQPSNKYVVGLTSSKSVNLNSDVSIYQEVCTSLSYIFRVWDSYLRSFNGILKNATAYKFRVSRLELTISLTDADLQTQKLYNENIAAFWYPFVKKMNRHEGVSCNHCSKVNFTGNRYKCLRCFDYDLCSVCYIANASSNEHCSKHAMQCIIARGDYDLYYGGETLTNTIIPQSLTCSYCARMGFTDVNLKEHILDMHQGNSCEILCPICASTPNGDPNIMVRDLSQHLTSIHNVPSKRRISFSIEEHIRPNISAGLRQQRQNNWQALQSVRRQTAHEQLVAAAAARDPADAIDELLTQIAHMRRLESPLVDPRNRYHQLRAMHHAISESRQQLRPNIMVIQNENITKVETSEMQQVSLPVPCYAPLLPNILMEKKVNLKETNEARAAFITELICSAIVDKPQDKNTED